MAEYKALPALVAAASPDRMTLAWVDHPIPPPPESGAGIAVLPADEARRLARDLAGDGYGLPFSVMFDGHGKACAIWHYPLHVDDLAALRAQCDHSGRQTRNEAPI